MNLLSMSPILGAMMSNVKRYDCSTVKETSKFNVKFEGRFLGYDAKSIPRRYVYTCSNHRNSLSSLVRQFTLAALINIHAYYIYHGSPDHKGPVIRATFFFNLSRNIVALEVETLCCAYYYICDQLVSQQNTVLQVEATCCSKLAQVVLCATNSTFAARITTEATT